MTDRTPHEKFVANWLHVENDSTLWVGNDYLYGVVFSRSDKHRGFVRLIFRGDEEGRRIGVTLPVEPLRQWLADD